MLIWLVSPWFHPWSCVQLFARVFSAPLSRTPALVHVSSGMWSAAGRQAVLFAVERWKSSSFEVESLSRHRLRLWRQSERLLERIPFSIITQPKLVLQQVKVDHVECMGRCVTIPLSRATPCCSWVLTRWYLSSFLCFSVSCRLFLAADTIRPTM